MYASLVLALSSCRVLIAVEGFDQRSQFLAMAVLQSLIDANLCRVSTEKQIWFVSDLVPQFLAARFLSARF